MTLQNRWEAVPILARTFRYLAAAFPLMGLAGLRGGDAGPKAPPRVNGPYPDRDGTRFRVRIFHHDLQRQDLYFHTAPETSEENAA